MKLALVHDYLGEFGGAERVLLALSEIWPEAPIYTAFTRPGPALERFKNREVVISWAHWLPFFATKLHSPLRFLAPFIWSSFDFSEYDVVISSASWFVTKGFGLRGKSPRANLAKGGGEGERGKGRPIEICYCHTPPRWLYGYETPVRKNWAVKAYVAVLAHFMRMYDWQAAQKVDYFIANSKNVQARVKKFYRRESVVIYPPVEIGERGMGKGERNYYLIVSRITGGKGIEMAVRVANKLKIPLKIAGAPSGYSDTYEWVKKHAGPTVELLGYVKDSELVELYRGAKAFLALARDEDFGITPVEAMAAGTPVIAYNGGGYPESVVNAEGQKNTRFAKAPARRGRTKELKNATGILFDDYNVEGLIGAIKRFEGLKIDLRACTKQAKKFSKERFKRQICEFVISVSRRQGN